MGEDDATLFLLRFAAHVIYWRGPSPYFFVPIPPQYAVELREAAKFVSYGWGMVPVEAKINDVVFATSLFPKDDAYLLPLKAAVRLMADITAGDLISVEMTISGVQR
jgi:hypothetical protein